MKTNKKMLIGIGFVTIFAVGIAFYLGFKFHEQKTKIKIRDIREIQELKIATAFVYNPDGKIYQLNDPEKIKEALMNCSKKPVAFSFKVEDLQKLFMVFYEQGQNKILEIPFEIDYNTFLCKYGTSKELKEYLKEIPYPYAIQGFDSRIPAPEGNETEVHTAELQIKDVQDIKDLKIVSAFVCRPRTDSSGQKTFDKETATISKPEMIKEALVNCNKEVKAFNKINTLTLFFYHKPNHYYILDIPFEIDCNTFLCEYGTSKKLKDYLEYVSYVSCPSLIDTEQEKTDSNDLNAPSPENR
jgi:hypothetical protein